MDIYSTGRLTVRATRAAADTRVVINPNDGFDMGLMMTEAPVMIYAGIGPGEVDSGRAEAVEGVVVQKNECRLGTLELSSGTSEKIGAASGVRLHLIPESPLPRLVISPE